jgi:hypothetical protein
VTSDFSGYPILAGDLFMGGVGGILAGLFLGLGNLFPYLAAKRSGVIVRKGARAVHVRRDEDPEGFARLLANRRHSAAMGFAGVAIGAVLLGLSGLLLTGTGVPRPGRWIVPGAIGLIGLAAAANLAFGFARGRMQGVLTYTLRGGEASLKRNPTWFWAYTLMNLVTVVAAAAFFYTRAWKLIPWVNG